MATGQDTLVFPVLQRHRYFRLKQATATSTSVMWLCSRVWDIVHSTRTKHCARACDFLLCVMGHILCECPTCLHIATTTNSLSNGTVASVGRQALQVFGLGTLLALLQSLLLAVPGAEPHALPSAALSMLCLCFCWVYGAWLRSG